MACLLVATCARRHTDGNRYGRRQFWPEPEAVQTCVGILRASRLISAKPKARTAQVMQRAPKANIVTYLETIDTHLSHMPCKIGALLIRSNSIQLSR